MTADERARLQLADLERVLRAWREVLPDTASDDRARDSAILRFELAFEVAWKLAQTVARSQGLSADSPRAAFGTAFRLGWVSDEAIWVDIMDARNRAVHVYHEPLARALAAELPRFVGAFEELAGHARRVLSTS